jgi:GntR family transcriptional regulator
MTSRRADIRINARYRPPVVEPRDDRPVFRQLAEQLRDQIHTGRLRPGDALPTQPQLTAEYGVSVTTIREAIDVLRGEGLVETVRGKGVFVRQPPPVRRVSSTRYADLLEALRDGHHTPESAFTRDLGIDWADYTVDCTFREAPASATIANLLQVEPNTAVFERHMIMRANGQAEQLRTCYYPLELVAGTAMTDPDRQPWPGGVIAELAELGVAITAVDEDVRTRMPTPDESYILRIPGGVPVFATTRVGYFGDRPVEAAADIIMPGDRIVLHYRLDL